jgi:hypothetical protein
MAKKLSKKQSLSIEHGLKYPWVKAERQWNILWILIPIFGWFALGGYTKKIIQEIVKGNVDGLPAFGKFWKNFTEGILLFLYMIPLVLLMVIINLVPIIGIPLSYFAGLLVVPYMFVNLIVKETFISTFDFESWWNAVVGNFGEYLLVVVYSIAYAILYGLLSLVLVGLPGSILGRYIFYADFYRRYAK